jgi:hypothetical protein
MIEFRERRGDRDMSNYAAYPFNNITSIYLI